MFPRRNITAPKLPCIHNVYRDRIGTTLLLNVARVLALQTNAVKLWARIIPHTSVGWCTLVLYAARKRAADCLSCLYFTLSFYQILFFFVHWVKWPSVPYGLIRMVSFVHRPWTVAGFFYFFRLDLWPFNHGFIGLTERIRWNGMESVSVRD